MAALTLSTTVTVINIASTQNSASSDNQMNERGESEEEM